MPSTGPIPAPDEVPLQAVVDPLHRERLPGEERGARVLAAAALGAGEGVEPLLPGEVERRARADPHLRLVARHRALEVDRRNDVARAAAPEEERRQGGHDVEVLSQRQDHEEGEHHRHLRPVREAVTRQKEVTRTSREAGGERVADAIGVEFAAAKIEAGDPFGDRPGGERDIGRQHQIA